MRIIKHTSDILILYNPARDFWSSNIFLLFSCPPIFLLPLLVSVNIWWKSLGLFMAAMFFLAVKNTWSSNVVKFCSFKKSCRKITIEYHGLQTKIKDFPLQDARVEVRRNIITSDYGTAFKSFEVLLVDLNNFPRGIALLEPYYRASTAETMLDRIQEFLLSSNRLT
jgi:hypothetical protein